RSCALHSLPRRVSSFVSTRYVAPRALPSFPTRRSSDHRASKRRVLFAAFAEAHGHRHHSDDHRERGHQDRPDAHKTGFDSGIAGDRKSTRLNSSHVESSYAVFCLKKKKSVE